MLDISAEFPASISAASLLTVSRAMKLGLEAMSMVTIWVDQPGALLVVTHLSKNVSSEFLKSFLKTMSP